MSKKLESFTGSNAPTCSASSNRCQQNKMMNYSGQSNGTKATLIATALPLGKKLYDPPGQSADKDRLLKFARTCGNCPAEIEAVTAESVGLEWHIEGKRMDWSDEHRKGRWVILQNDHVLRQPIETPTTTKDGY